METGFCLNISYNGCQVISYDAHIVLTCAYFNCKCQHLSNSRKLSAPRNLRSLLFPVPIVGNETTGKAAGKCD